MWMVKYMSNHAGYQWDMNTMEKCFPSTSHSSYMVLWWVLVHLMGSGFLSTIVFHVI